jgi:hypothetical protein
MEPLLWLILEAAIALALLLFIVWWTWPRKPRANDGAAPPGKDDER